MRWLWPILVSGAADAQPSVSPARVPSVDSARVLRVARRAQASFEATRRARLPITTGGTSRECDVRIGRYCYWYNESDPPPPPEPAAIGAARHRLIATLDSLVRIQAGDEWLVGQVVRYRLEAGDEAGALRAAAACRSTTWWCATLAGHVHHVASRYADADSAFARALAAMPPKERCAWTDIGLLLEGPIAGRWKAASCSNSQGAAKRDSIASHLWWLADPMMGVAGNDRRTEHLARHTIARLERMAPSGYESRWGEDAEELLLRFGWPIGWSRRESSPYGQPSVSIVGHEPSPSYHFLPLDGVTEKPIATLRETDWNATLRMARERYAPAYLRRRLTVRAQMAAFQRQDSTLVIAAVAVDPDTALADDSLVTVLAASTGPGEPLQVSRRGLTGPPLRLMIGRAPALTSVEVMAPAARAAGRRREGIAGAAATRLAVSSVVVYDPGAATPSSLDAALQTMHADLRLPLSRRVGMAWETYGLGANGETVDVSLVVERVGAAWTQRAAERLRLATRARPLRVRWAETPDRRSGAAFRAIAVDLGHLAPGRYEVRLDVHGRGGAAASSVREIELMGR